jgi:uncharacterized membrane protein YoaK (UPF0700 family)
MLHAAAYTLRQQSRLAISLSWIAGYTNVLVFVGTGMMVSHVTGNLTHFGQLIETLNWRAALFCGWLPLMFFLGAMISSASIAWAKLTRHRSHYVLPMAIQAVLLATTAVVFSLHLRNESKMTGGELWLITALASLAMGLQNATITVISAATVRTTHLTGVFTDAGMAVVHLTIWLSRKLTISRPRPSKPDASTMRSALSSTTPEPSTHVNSASTPAHPPSIPIGSRSIPIGSPSKVIGPPSTSIGPPSTSIGPPSRKPTPRLLRPGRLRRVIKVLRRQPHARQLFLLCNIAGSFTLGVLMASLVHDRLPVLTLLPPVMFLLFMILLDWRRPIDGPT